MQNVCINPSKKADSVKMVTVDGRQNDLIHSQTSSILASAKRPLTEEEDISASLKQASSLLFVGVAASQDQDFGTANLHLEVSDVVSVLVYVGVAKGNGVLSKTGESY